MNNLFGYPEYNNDGERVLTKMEGPYENMLMDISSFKMSKGQSRTFHSNNKETAILLIKGNIDFEWDNEKKSADRADFFKEGAWCLHVCKDINVKITARDESEILVQSTTNDKTFKPVFYAPTDCKDETFGQGLYGNKAVRTVRTLFDYSTAPYSNMVLGEILNHHGNWSSYIPHEHPQPEVYYYRYDKPQGFGACFIGDDVFKVKDGSFAAIPGGKTHPQVTAPGYPMYYVWMIRHFDDNPWTDRIEDQDHVWLKNVTL